MCVKTTSSVSSHGIDNLTPNIFAKFMGALLMGLVTLCMFCTNCLRGAHGYAIDGFCGFLGSCFVPIACYGWVQLPTTRDMGLCACVWIEHRWFSVLPLIAMKLIFTRVNRIVAIMLTSLLVACQGMIVIAQGFLRLRPVTTAIGSRNSTLRPPLYSNASTRWCLLISAMSDCANVPLAACILISQDQDLMPELWRFVRCWGNYNHHRFSKF